MNKDGSAFKMTTLRRTGLDCASFNGVVKKIVLTSCGFGAGILGRQSIFIKLIADREHSQLWPWLTFRTTSKQGKVDSLVSQLPK